MKIALVNVIKPQEGSRDGMTEYTYQLYERIRKKHVVDLVYVTEKSKRLDSIAYVYANTLFKFKVRKLAKKKYDIIHITNQELGFVAKTVKKLGTKAKVITSIHDLMRMDINSVQGFSQRMYSRLVARSIMDCFKFSDSIIFSASTVEKDAVKRFGGMFGAHVTTLLGPSEEFRTAPIPKKTKRREFVVGYVGAFAPWKNPMFVLKTAKLLKDDKSIVFKMYGHGPEEEVMRAYKSENRLENLEIKSFPAQNRFLEMYDGFDLFFYPTLEEGSSLPMINSQCRGLPVVIYKGNKVDDEVTRYCFVSKDEKDAAGLIRGIEEKGFETKRRQIMLKYVRGFSWDRVAKETLDVYHKVLAQKG
ncbi:MAG: glycosyltransferase [Candidatus Micrarchaeota archaeon]|nr:glycosyltransferase [Candidatus Micrarchaeota archaeon]